MIISLRLKGLSQTLSKLGFTKSNLQQEGRLCVELSPPKQQSAARVCEDAAAEGSHTNWSTGLANQTEPAMLRKVEEGSWRTH